MSDSTISAAGHPPVQSDLPPLLDRELFFGNPQITSGQLSPDGKYISFMKPYEGILNVWVKNFDEPFEAARPVTDSKRPLYGYGWSEDGKYIFFVKDNDGDENINLWRVDPAEADGTTIPAAKNLTPMEKVTAQIIHISQNDPDLMWVGLNNRDEAWHDLYRLQISSGELTLVYENTDRITGYEFDWDDHLRLLSRTDDAGTTTILRKDGDDLVPIYETLVSEGASVLSWDKENQKLYLETNTGDLNLSTLFLMDPNTGEKILVEGDPENRVDFGSLRVDRNTREVISTSYTDDRTRYYWRNPEWEANFNFLKERFPGREIDFQSSTNDYRKFLIVVYGDRYASESWFFDADSRELIFQYTPRPELKEVEQHLAPMEPVRYASSDGLEIPGYLTVPQNVEAKNLPLVVLVHGGPKGPRDNWGYDAQAQFLANRGYAVLQPNFRASGGYGKEFLNAGDLQWGRLMQDDITWGVKHLIEQGVADPERVAIMGGSYGGYATLAGLAFTPELYACGVDIVGPSNLFTLLDSVPAYWEAGRAFLYGMVGDPNTEEGKALIRAASPLFRADQIVRPLLIIQGANDPRVKQAEADQIAIALRDRGHDVSYLLAEDEGHGFAKPVNRMAMYAEIERFLAEKIGGRYQESMPSDVAQRLEELRVDISQVTYEPPAQVELATQLPLAESRFSAGQEEWLMQIELPGQTLELNLQRKISVDDEVWVFEDQLSGPMGAASDRVSYDAQLRPLQRQVVQGGVTIEATFGDHEISIEIGAQGAQFPVGGALLCDGPGREMILASLELTEGQEVFVEVPDMVSQKLKPAAIKHEGQAEFEGKPYSVISVTTVGEANSKITYWQDPESRRIVRSHQVNPQLNNATIIRTLKQ